MENSKKPAYPITDSSGKVSIITDGYFEANQKHLGFGLTKREYFAGLAMQGLLSNTAFTFGDHMTPEGQIAECSRTYADELLRQLEK